MKLSKEFVEKLSDIFFGNDVDEDIINYKQEKCWKYLLLTLNKISQQYF